MMTNDGAQSVAAMSDVQTVFTGKVTHAERAITKIQQTKGVDLEKLRLTIDEQKEEIKELQTKFKAATARRDTLEKQLKTIKTEFGMKIKMLLDKTENDDKLIQMLKAEISRLENVKGTKSTLQKEAPISPRKNVQNEIRDLQRDNANLKNQVKCSEIEIEQKNAKISKMMESYGESMDGRAEAKNLKIAELEAQCESLEK